MGKTAYVITAAGTSSRFSRELGREALKCVYTEGRPEDAILHRLVSSGLGLGLDPIVVVGGYRMEEVREFFARNFAASPSVSLVENPLYRRGSLYSLYLGIAEALRHPGVSEVVFAEGDLVVDEASFARVARSAKDVLTTCPEPITAQRSVAVYVSATEQVRFVYDTQHVSLSIPEPFRAVYNSGQVWKFADAQRLRALCARIGSERYDETNLGLIQEYFLATPPSGREIVPFASWHNCNTPADYRRAIKGTQ